MYPGMFLMMGDLCKIYYCSYALLPNGVFTVSSNDKLKSHQCNIGDISYGFCLFFDG